MMRAILFDLDGTLLDVDTGSFMERYFAAVKRLAIPGFDGDLFGAVVEGTRHMMGWHEGLTNEDVFWDRFVEVTGGAKSDFEPYFARFYDEVFPTLQGDAGPAPHAREAVQTALEHGFTVVVATNPLFPRVAIDHRIAWAGLSDVLDGAHVTSYEVSTACKPLPGYYQETAAAVGATPIECLMVGDDAELDLPAASTGMRTFYVGPDRHAHAELRGTLGDLVEMLGRL
jgi:FMN phosphatase YigB (HAD superfamily)